MKKAARNKGLLALLLAGMLCLGGCGGMQADGDSAFNDNGTGAPEGTPQDTPTDGATARFDETEVTTGALDVTYTDRELSGAYYDTVTELALSGEDVTISAAGTYLLTGTLTDGQIVVEAGDADKVQLVLNGVSVTNSDGPAIEVRNADKVFLTLAEGSDNVLRDGDSYALAAGEDEPNACVYAKADLCVNGGGSLTIYGNYNHGIYTKDDLVITNGTVTVYAANDGLKGKDCVKICGGTITVEADGDGIQSNQDADAARGYVSIDGGTFFITAGCDGIQAETCLQVTAGTLTLKSGGGSENASTKQDSGWGFWGAQTSASEETESAKGLKAGTALYLAGGEFVIDSSDDALHSNGDMTIAGGTFSISSGDDGAHADDALQVLDGTLEITKSYEGLEGNSITISGGEIVIEASDDGINAAGGSDGSSVNGRPGQGSFDVDTSAYIRITGGAVTIDADGDGVDSNGAFSMEDGTLLIHGPSDSANGFLDYASDASVTGGTVVAVGSAGMAQGFGGNSTQCSVLHTFDTQLAAGTTLTVSDSSGNDIIEFTASKAFTTILVSSPAFALNETYTFTAGTQRAEITLETISSGTAGMQGMRPGGAGGGKDGMFGGTAPSDGAPTPPDGETPDFADGEAPESPAGTWPNGTRPDMFPDGGTPEGMSPQGETDAEGAPSDTAGQGRGAAA